MNPLGSIFAQTRIAPTITKIGTARLSLLALLSCLIWKVSAIVSLSARSAVSPDVIGRIIIPISATAPPIGPSAYLHTTPTTLVGEIATSSPPF